MAVFLTYLRIACINCCMNLVFPLLDPGGTFFTVAPEKHDRRELLCVRFFRRSSMLPMLGNIRDLPQFSLNIQISLSPFCKFSQHSSQYSTFRLNIVQMVENALCTCAICLKKQVISIKSANICCMDCVWQACRLNIRQYSPQYRLNIHFAWF